MRKLSAWHNRSPGDLSVELPEITAVDVPAAVESFVMLPTPWREFVVGGIKTITFACAASYGELFGGALICCVLL